MERLSLPPGLVGGTDAPLVYVNGQGIVGVRGKDAHGDAVKGFAAHVALVIPAVEVAVDEEGESPFDTRAILAVESHFQVNPLVGGECAIETEFDGVATGVETEAYISPPWRTRRYQPRSSLPFDQKPAMVRYSLGL